MTTVPDGATPEQVAAVVEALRFPPSKDRTLGVEWEIGLVDPTTLDLVPRAAELLALVDDDAGGAHARQATSRGRQEDRADRSRHGPEEAERDDGEGLEDPEG